MQERRTTVRVNRLSRAQYCPAEDLVPRDGRITTLTERGIGLLAHEVHRAGERVTVSFSISDEEEPLTATGVVRWSNAQPSQGRWYPMGLEWLPLEDTVRHRLHAFLGSYAQTAIGHPPIRRETNLRTAQRFVIGGLLVIGLLIGVMLFRWAITLLEENSRLYGTIQERNLRVSQLEQRGTKLEQELASSKAHLAAASEAMAQLGQQAQYFESGVQRLSQEVDRFQHSYAQLREEREQLIQRVLDLEQERFLLSKKLSSITDLRQAISDAIEARRQAQHRKRVETRRQAHARDRALVGNRGYVVWKGQPTTGRPTLWIKVHEPEPLIK